MDKIEFWINRDERIMDPSLFSQKASDLAEEVGQHPDTKNKKKKKNQQSQIRKFYDEVLKLNNLAQSPNSKIHWEHIKPLVHMLVAKSAYAKGRGKITDNFHNFIKNSVEQVDEKEDLKVFCNIFEAFMGFYRLHGPKTR